LPDLSDPAVRKLAADILARREFAHTKTPIPDLWWLKWIRKVLDWLATFGDLRMSDPGLYWIVVAMLGVILIAIIFLIARNISETLRAAELPPPPSPAGSPPDLAAEAESLAAAGRYLEAAHRLMIASFRAMGERSLIELRPDRSNLWIRGALRKSALAGGLALEIDRLIERTERRWFGLRENDPEIYTQWRSAFARLTAVQNS
jgi:hypothetical protein